MKAKVIKEPIYLNEDFLKKCMKSEPHSLIFDSDFSGLNEVQVLNLCKDLDSFWDWFEKVNKATPIRLNSLKGTKEIDERKDFEMSVCVSCSLVWSALFFLHDEWVPEKYKHEV